ncbi:MAG: EcsC family protein [Ktedonobacterales bacterium]
MASSNQQGGGITSNISNTIAQSAVEALPPEIKDLLKPGKTPDRIQQAINWAAKRDAAVVARHQARGHKIGALEDIRTLPVEQVDKVANDFARKFRHRAALTGAITGLPGGLWAVVAAGADVQLTAVYAVRMVADIAQAYGYDTSLADEQTHLAEVLAIAAGIDSIRGIGNMVAREGLAHMLPELLPKVLVRLSVQLTEEQAAKWVGRLIPGIGAAVGASIDYTFLRVAGERAIHYYHNRYLVDHGLASPDILPTFAQPPALPAGSAPQAAGEPARVVDGSLVSGPVSVPAAAGQQALPAPLAPAPAQKAVKARKTPPERFAIWLGIFAVFALFATIAACTALGYLVTTGIQNLFH